MSRWMRSLDWKFLVALAFAVMVAYLAYVGVASIQDGREKDRRIDALIEATEEKDHLAQQAAALAAHERRDAARERRLMTRNQAALLAYTKALASRQTALLTWLRHHGIALPQRLVDDVAPPRLIQQQRASGNRTSGGRPRQPSTNKAPAAKPTPHTSSDPSNSKPGKGKGRGKGGKSKKPKKH